MFTTEFFFRTLIQKSIIIQLNYFQDFKTKAVKARYKIWKRKQAKALNTISVVYLLRNQLVYRKIFTDDYYPSGYFGGRALWADSGHSRMNTIAPRDQFKPIRIGENLVVNYNL